MALHRCGDQWLFQVSALVALVAALGPLSLAICHWSFWAKIRGEFRINFLGPQLGQPRAHLFFFTGKGRLFDQVSRLRWQENKSCNLTLVPCFTARQWAQADTQLRSAASCDTSRWVARWFHRKSIGLICSNGNKDRCWAYCGQVMVPLLILYMQCGCTKTQLWTFGEVWASEPVVVECCGRVVVDAKKGSATCGHFCSIPATLKSAWLLMSMSLPKELTPSSLRKIMFCFGKWIFPCNAIL